MEDTSEARLDDLMSCLSDETRRGILATLRASDPGDGVKERQVAARSNSVSAIATRHVHLPKLDDADLIEWDQDDGVVFRGPNFEDGVLLLDAFEATRDH